jgi:hypothetical protein
MSHPNQPTTGVPAVATSERAFGWARLLVQHRPASWRLVRRAFALELLREVQSVFNGNVCQTCRWLHISRNTFHYAQRAWDGKVQLSGPQTEAVRQIARELMHTPGGYRPAVQLFSQLVAKAALKAARQRHRQEAGEMVADVTNAAALVNMHRNSIYRITRAERMEAARG